MLRKMLSGLALCALGAHLALGGGIPVFDGVLNSTAAVQLHQQITTATQNVAQTLKQIDQYAEQVRQYQTQLQQYAQQLKDAALPVSQIWSQAQGTMRNMMSLVNQARAVKCSRSNTMAGCRATATTSRIQFSRATR